MKSSLLRNDYTVCYAEKFQIELEIIMLKLVAIHIFKRKI